jgi:hypothetical protein
VKSKDVFAEGLNLNFEGQEKIKTSCGGFCSILRKFASWILLAVCCWTIAKYNTYSVSPSSIFYDIDDLQINFTDNIQDFTFGFKWENR